MKLYPLIWLVLAVSAFAESDAIKTPAERPRLTTEERRNASKGDSSSAKAGGVNATSSAQDSVAMAPVEVTGSYVPPTRRAEDEDPESRPFAWKEGGTILKRDGPVFTTQLVGQYNPRVRAWEFFKISW